MTSSTVAAQLRRRREASRRMPTLEFERDRRDPIDIPAGQRRTAITVMLDRHSAHFTGSLGPIFKACRVTSVPAMRRARNRAQISVPRAFADDVISNLQYGQGRPVYVIDEVTL